MKAMLYRRGYRALVSITLSLLAIIMISAAVYHKDMDGFVAIMWSKEFMCSFIFLALLIYMFLTEPRKLSERELAGYPMKNHKRTVLSRSDIDKFESEAQYAKESEDYYTNPENFK